MSDTITIPKSIDGIEEAIRNILSDDTPTSNIVRPAFYKEKIFREYKRIMRDTDLTSSQAIESIAIKETQTFESITYIVKVWPYQHKSCKN